MRLLKVYTIKNKTKDSIEDSRRACEILGVKEINEIHQAPVCQLVYTTEMMHGEQDKMEYSGTWKEIWTQKGEMEGTIDDLYIYDGWEKSKADIRITADRISESLNIRLEDKVLEVGCGAGALAQYMDCQYYGIDYSRSLLKKHIEFFGNSVIYAEANDIPFKDKYFDKCFCWGVFLYFDSYKYAQEVIREMKRVTKEGILIGELPMISHDNKHLLYQKEMFPEWKIQDAWTESYKGKRFIVIIDNEVKENRGGVILMISLGHIFNPIMEKYYYHTSGLCGY